jgi:16S rRNA (cytidine1402-2'-O)-methyltransferase
MNTGSLYIVATPIGNLGDITLRALEVLKEVDLIAAEDTRTARHLLSHFGITKQAVSYYDAVETTRAASIIAALKQGKNIAPLSECGTPLISDPGYKLARRALEEGIPLFPIPGPTALISALIVSGLPTDKFVFEGYLSRNPSRRRKRLRELVAEERTMVFYESPHRLLKMLTDVQAILGNRTVAVARELTKKFEEKFRGTVSEALCYYTEKGVRGEFVVVIEGLPDGSSPNEDQEPEEASDETDEE